MILNTFSKYILLLLLFIYIIFIHLNYYILKFILEDLFPPVITHNSGLQVEEKSFACINSSMLAAVDEHQKHKDLIFSLTSFPVHGYLEKKGETGKPISSFLMSDLKASRICYIHRSSSFSNLDGFSFTVSDGKNYVSGIQKFTVYTNNNPSHQIL